MVGNQEQRQAVQIGKEAVMNKQGNEQHQNPLEKMAGRAMGGKTAQGDESPQIVIGQEYGRTPYSGEAEKMCVNGKTLGRPPRVAGRPCR
jgi:hypothetical protein